MAVADLLRRLFERFIHRPPQSATQTLALESAGEKLDHSLPLERRNAPGEFAVAAECCTLCGVPWHFAPDLFDHDDGGCWVKRQPETPDEKARMREVLQTQELGCISYSGSDPQFKV